MKYTAKFAVLIIIVSLFAVGVFASPVSTEIYDGGNESAQLSGENTDFSVPEDYVTSEKLVKLFAKLHLVYQGKPMTFDENSDYEVYLAYCKQNKIIADDNSFDEALRPVLRSELALVATNTFPESFFEVKYPDALPTDVLPGDDCYNSVVTLYKSGVANGIERGYYCPNFPLTEAQLTSFVERLVLIDSRLKGDILDLPDMKEAYYLIFDQTMTRTKRSVEHVTSSWNYDNRQKYAIDVIGTTSGVLEDVSTDGYVAINRTIKTQSDGKLTFVTIFKADEKNGIRIYFENTLGENVFEIYTKNNVYNIKAKTLTATRKASTTEETVVKVEFDLDNAMGTFCVDGSLVTSFALGDFKNFSKLYFSTGVSETLVFKPGECYLYKNYAVNESFFASEIPYDWETDNVVVTYNNDDGMGDNSLKLEHYGFAGKGFDELSGKVVFETYFYVPSKDDVFYISFGNINTEIHGGYIINGNISHEFKPHVWQCLYIEADTDTKKAKLYVNGKFRGETEFSDSSFSEVYFEFEKNSVNGYALVDDVSVYNIYDYPDYCPEPIKAQSDDYNLIMSVCSLWREGTHYGWDYVSPYDECSPLMGYYDEGIPETADWETKLAVEHGVDAMEYCWYASHGLATIKKPKLNWALHDGYFHGKYSDMMDFLIMWENQGFKSITGMTLESFRTYIWDYWVEWYFRDERYFKIDNKAVLHVYLPGNFKNSAGSVENVKAIVDFMREDIKNYGYDGLILLAQNKFTSKDQVKELVNMGYDGNCIYSWDSSSYDPDYLKLLTEDLLGYIDEAQVDFFQVPTVATGRNIMGWGNKRTPLATPEQHTELLKYYKSVVEEQKDDYNLVYFSTWNEYGEGHWLAPSGLNGFGYTEVWRNVLCDDDCAHNDVIPTANQKSRICRMYNDTRTPIRSLLNEVPGYSDLPTKPVLVLDFNDPSVASDWMIGSHISSYSFENGCLNVVPADNDPMIHYKKDINLEADNVDFIHIRMKNDSASFITIYFNYENNVDYVAERNLQVSYNGKNKGFFDLYISTDECEAWTDTIRRIRIDPSSNMVTSSIDLVEFLQITEELNPFDVYADGRLVEIPNRYKEISDGEYYVAGDPLTGFYSANNLYYEWSRFTEKFLLVTADDTRFVFTVGSSTVLVNGEEKQLKKPFYLFDGMPVIPLLFVFESGEIEYEISDKRINTVQRNYDYEEVMSSRVDFQYEFNLYGDLEGWTQNGAKINVSNGNMIVVSTPSSGASTGYDPNIRRENILFDSKEYKTVTVRMKYTFYENKVQITNSHRCATLYFTTTADSTLNEAKSVKKYFGTVKADNDGYITLVFDMASNSLWTGLITSIRFDPTNLNGKYEIDYIRVT